MELIRRRMRRMDVLEILSRIQSLEATQVKERVDPCCLCKDRVIVIYVGEDQAILEHLGTQLDWSSRVCSDTDLP